MVPSAPSVRRTTTWSTILSSAMTPATWSMSSVGLTMLSMSRRLDALASIVTASGVRAGIVGIDARASRAAPSRHAR